MVHTKAEILVNKEIAPGHFKVVIRIGGFKGAVKAGQFFHIKAGSDYDPLLRRPISVHRVGSKPDIIELLYKVVGKGTRLLSRRSKATYLDVIGPLGNGFRVPKQQSNFILVAGGVGIAPLVALVDELARFRKRSITVICGAKTKAFIVCRKELQDLGAKVVAVTEDGSDGHRGFASGILRSLIGQFDLRRGLSPQAFKGSAGLTIGDYRPEVGIYACGPTGMLREVAKIARYYRIEAQGSLEEKMACGIGACLGCAVKTLKGYKRVCRDGPVFNLEEIAWE